MRLVGGSALLLPGVVLTVLQSPAYMTDLGDDELTVCGHGIFALELP